MEITPDPINGTTFAYARFSQGLGRGGGGGGGGGGQLIGFKIIGAQAQDASPKRD